jgi:hypothetical protein
VREPMRYNRRKAMPKNRTNLQNKIFHQLVGKAGLSNDDKAVLVFDFTKGRTDSSKEMRFDEMNAAIKHLGGTVFDSKEKRAKTWFPKNVVAIVSTLQKQKMESLKESRNMSDEGFAKLCRAILKGIPYPRTSKEAQKVIEAIKAMNSRDSKAPKAKTQEVA